MRNIAGILLAGLLILPVLTSCGRIPDWTDRERMCRDFLLREMTEEDGTVYTRTNVTRSLFRQVYDRTELLGSGILSESVGLLMRYALLDEDPELFAREADFVRKRLISNCGLIRWKVSADRDLVSTSNAAIDDLRIAHVLVLAGTKWGKSEYLETADGVSQNILYLMVSDGGLRDYLDWEGCSQPQAAGDIVLSYLDLEAMRALEDRDPRWSPVLERSKAIMEAGALPTGLFMERYDYESGSYLGEQANMINQIYCGMHMAPSQAKNRGLLDFLRERFEEDGVIYASYDARTGKPSRFFESTSVYAMSARYAMRMGDEAFAMRCLKKMVLFQNRNRVSPLFGSFADDEVYSFDNLQALLALKEFNLLREKE